MGKENEKKPEQVDLEEYLSARALWLKDGREVPNGTPMARPAGFRAQPSMMEIVRTMVRDARFAAEMEAQGMETIDESDDFDVDDDNYDPQARWERQVDEVPIKELRKRDKALREKAEREKAEKSKKEQTSSTETDTDSESASSAE